MQRIAVIGCGGSGKTTLSRRLGELQERLAAADAAIFLDLPTVACLWGIVRRRLRFRGQSRPELGVYDRVTWPFIRWIWSFRWRQRPRILELLAACDIDVIVVRRRRDATALVGHLERRAALAADLEPQPQVV